MFKIRIPSTGQIYQIKTKTVLKPDQEILVEIDDILETAIVCCSKGCQNKEANEKEAEAIFIRVLTDEDSSFKKNLEEKAKEFLPEAQKKVNRHNLDMKILDAELSFDEKKLTFYFSAEGRIDFRSLVADMAGSFRKIIRLQQIGSRGQAKLLGGFGRCGQELCCRRFLRDLENINTETIALQEIAGGKLSKSIGCCGKPMCCLSYENQTLTNTIEGIKAKLASKKITKAAE